MATAPPLPPKPVLTAPPTPAPHKRGQNPVEFDNLMQPFVNWVCGKWFPDAAATIDYMGVAIQLSQTASADAKTAAEAAETATDAADTAVQVMNHMQALYLGPKEAPPTLNNTGGPLVKGSLYLNTVQGAWYWWDGAQWVLGMSDISALTVQWGNVQSTPKTQEGYGINLAHGAASMAITYDGSRRVSAIREVVSGNNLDTAITYNGDGTVNTITADYMGLTRVETFAYTGGKVTGYTSTEVQA